MQLSKARRFLARFHTAIVAVLEPKDGEWELQMELHMKMDFGALTSRLKVSRIVSPIGVGQAELFKNLTSGSKPQRRAKRINVDNKELFGFSYEAWTAALNTCSKGESSRRGPDKGISFDVRDPATAIPFMNVINGTVPTHGVVPLNRKESMNKRVFTAGYHIGVELCKGGFREAVEKAQIENNGEFYTDSYFSQVVEGVGKFTLRQFIKPGFQKVSIPHDSYTAVNGGVGQMSLARKNTRDGSRRFRNLEKAVDPMEN